MGANSVPREHTDAAWHHLLDADGLDADIALVQEAVLPAWLHHEHDVHWLPAWPKTRRWGTGIVAKKECALLPLQHSAPDTRYAMGRVIIGNTPVVVVSIHAFTTMRRDWFSDNMSLSFVQRLQATFDAIGDRLKDRFVVGGDLNTGRIAEEIWPGQGHGAFWKGLDGRGFRSCPWSQTGTELMTYEHPRGPFKGQADHILLDAVTAEQVTHTRAPELLVKLSDHRPLVVALERA